MLKRKRRIYFRDLSIGKKFTVSLILFLIIPLSALFVWINYSLINRINNQNLKTNLAILKQTKTPITYMIQDMSYVSLQIIGNENLQKYLSEKDTLPQKQSEEILNQIRYDTSQLLQSREYITRLAVFDQNKVYMQIGAYLETEKLNGLDQVSKLHGKPIWFPASLESHYISSWDRIYEVPMLRSINSVRRLNLCIGYLRLNADEKYLCSLYSGIRDSGTNGLFIVNQDGDVISSVNKNFLNHNVAEEPYFKKVTGMEEGFFKIDHSQYVSFYKIDKTNWYVLKIDNADEFIEGRLLNSLVLLFMGMVVLFGVIFFIIQKEQIINPVKMLSKNVVKFHEGDYEILQYTKSKDEIGILNQSFIEMSKYIEELIERVYKSQIKEKEAQLSYLQSQINPHFLYNTLDSLRWMAIKEKQYDLAGQIEALANLFKHALNEGKEMTTAGEELSHLKNYLLIQKNKFGDRLVTDIQMEESLENIPVLKLILQPIVENSIIHGLGEKIGEGKIIVTVRKIDRCLVYEVKDNGLGTDENKIKNILISGTDSHNALALDNINKRLKYKYGEQYGIHFSSEIGRGTIVTVKIPLEEE